MRKQGFVLAVAGLVVVVMSMGSGHAQPRAEASYTVFRTAMNGVMLPAVQLPGVPHTVPFHLKPGGYLPPPGRCLKQTSSTPEASCGAGQEDWYYQWWMTVYNSSGDAMFSYSQWYAWSGTGAGGEVTSIQTDCENDGGYFTYNGCETDSSPPGGQSVHVHGAWSYNCCWNNNWGYHDYPSADATATDDGSIYGTVYT